MGYYWLLSHLLLRLFHLFVGWTWFFLSQHHHLESEVCNPLLTELEVAVELSERYHGLQGTGIREVVLIEDIVHGLSSHLIQGVLHEARQTELELHQVADEHHEILAEGLELLEINIHILQLLAVLADAGINLPDP